MVEPLTAAVQGLTISKLMAPPPSNICEDLQVLHQLRLLKIKVGDVQIAGWDKSSYDTLQELLVDLKTVKESFDGEAWMQSSLHCRQMHPSQRMQVLKIVQPGIPAAVKQTHREIARLLEKLSDQARVCIKAGVSFQDIEDAWDLALQDRNNAFFPPPPSL